MRPESRILGSWRQDHGFLAFGNSRRGFAQARVGHAQTNTCVCLNNRTYFDLLKLAAKTFYALLVSRACCGYLAGELLTEGERKNVLRVALRALDGYIS